MLGIAPLSCTLLGIAPIIVVGALLTAGTLLLRVDLHIYHYVTFISIFSHGYIWCYQPFWPFSQAIWLPGVWPDLVIALLWLVELSDITVLALAFALVSIGAIALWYVAGVLGSFQVLLEVSVDTSV